MKTVMIPLRSKGQTIRVREYDAPPRDARVSFYTIQITELNRNGKATQSMVFTPESADAVRLALKILEADIEIQRSQT